MIDFNATFGHGFFQDPIGDAATHIEKHSGKDCAFGGMVPLGTNHHSRLFALYLEVGNKHNPADTTNRGNFATEIFGRPSVQPQA